MLPSLELLDISSHSLDLHVPSPLSPSALTHFILFVKELTKNTNTRVKIIACQDAESYKSNSFLVDYDPSRIICIPLSTANIEMILAQPLIDPNCYFNGTIVLPIYPFSSFLIIFSM